MAKIVNAALKAKAWTFEAKAKATGAKAKAIGPEEKAKAKTIKIGLEAPRGQGLSSRTTSLCIIVCYCKIPAVCLMIMMCVCGCITVCFICMYD